MAKQGTGRSRSLPGTSRGDSYFAVERILSKRMENGRIEYLIKWEGFSKSQSSWEPKEHLHADALIQEFERSFIQKPKTRMKNKMVATKLQTTERPLVVPSFLKLKELKPKHGFERGLKLDKIFGICRNEEGDLEVMVKWEENPSAEKKIKPKHSEFSFAKQFQCSYEPPSSQCDIVYYEDVKKRYPEKLAEYMASIFEVKHDNCCGKPKVADLDEVITIHDFSSEMECTESVTEWEATNECNIVIKDCRSTNIADFTNM